LANLAFIKLLRPHQWAKNLLVFAPAFFSGKMALEGLLGETMVLSAIAFVSMCAIASASYVLNDVADRREDSLHPEKKSRPIAAGEVTTAAATIISILLLALGFILAQTLSIDLTWALLAYLVVQIFYTYLLKDIVIVDVLTLSSLLTMRLAVGAAATGIHASNWIIILTWLLSLMLGVGKRYTEYSHLKSAGTRPVLLSYSKAFLRELLSGAGVASLLCYLLWCSEGVRDERFNQAGIYPTAVIMAYGIFRYQLLVQRGKFDEDPARGLMNDLPILAAIFLFLSVLFFQV
jgi:4-hydroxybenzoate polyprenyltransferase